MADERWRAKDDPNSFVHEIGSQLQQLQHLDLFGCAAPAPAVEPKQRVEMQPPVQLPKVNPNAETERQLKEIQSLIFGLSTEMQSFKANLDQRLQHLENRTEVLAAGNVVIAQTLGVDSMIPPMKSADQAGDALAGQRSMKLAAGGSSMLRRMSGGTGSMPRRMSGGTGSMLKRSSANGSQELGPPKPRSELLERIGFEVDFLYKDATTPAYAKVEDKEEELMCVSLREGDKLDAFDHFMDWAFGICKPDMKIGKEGSHMIHPLSRFKAGWTMLMLGILIYSALMVPVQLSFWSGDNVCYQYPTIKWDVTVDFLFFVDILVALASGAYVDGRYIDDPKAVARNYFLSRNGFLIDAVSCIPLASIDYFISSSTLCADQCTTQLLSNCEGADQQSLGDERIARLSRLLKLIRLVQLTRLLKFTNISTKFDDVIEINPLVVRMVKVYGLLVIVVHMVSCAYWRLKLETKKSNEELNDYVVSKGVDPNDNFDLYMMCFYFIFTVTTTVGFGDIYAVNWQERLFCVVVFMFAATLFGTVLGEITDILNTMRKKEKMLEDHMEGYSNFFWDYRVPKDVAKQVKQWVRFQYCYEDTEQRKKEVLEDEKLPEVLRAQLASRLSDGIFAQVPFIFKYPQDLKTSLAGQLMLRMESKYYMPNMAVAVASQPADRLMIIMSGKVEIRVPDPLLAGRSLRVVHEGFVIGDCCVHCDERWGGGFGINADFVAITNCVVASITYDQIQEVISKKAFSAVRLRLEVYTVMWDRKVEADPSLLMDDPELTKAPKSDKERDQDLKTMRGTFHWILLARQLLYSKKRAAWLERMWASLLEDDFRVDPGSRPARRAAGSGPGRGGSGRLPSPVTEPRTNGTLVYATMDVDDLPPSGYSKL